MITQYDLVAREYARWIAPKYGAIAQLVVDAARPGPEAHVVELAAGTGALTRLLAPTVVARGRYVAVDVSAPMLGAARVDHRVQLVVADLLHLPLPDASADLVVCSLGPAQDRAALTEALRVLRPGGHLTTVTWGDDYAELALLNAARTSVGLAPYPTGAAAAAALELAGLGCRDARTTTVRLPVLHSSLDDYLSYRAAFGCPPGLDPARLAAFHDAVRAQALHHVAASGAVHLDWQLVLLEATKPAPVLAER